MSGSYFSDEKQEPIPYLLNLNVTILVDFTDKIKI